MNHLKTLGLLALAATALIAFLGAGTASATKLYKYTTPSGNDQLANPALSLSSAPETPIVMATTDEKTVVDSCANSQMQGTIEVETPTSHPRGRLSDLIFPLAECTHKTTVLSKGELEIKHIAGTTNGTVILKNTEITILSTTFGVSCVAKAEGGTPAGNLTGAKSKTGHATFHLFMVIPTGFLCGGDSRWKGDYIVTSPTGLTVESS